MLRLCENKSVWNICNDYSKHFVDFRDIASYLVMITFFTWLDC